MARPTNRRQASLCPCGTGRAYSACCRPFHLRTEAPPTAEAVMRSRYSAYAKRNADYVLHSWHPDTRPPTLELGAEPVWTGLTVLRTVDGGSDDTTGIVEFEAAFTTGARPSVLHEVSEFARLDGPDGPDGRWVYVGEQPGSTT